MHTEYISAKEKLRRTESKIVAGNVGTLRFGVLFFWNIHSHEKHLNT